MRPYYQDDSVTIYHGDCREILPDIRADVMVTDPPYGMAYRSGWSGNAVVGDSGPEVRDEVLRLWGNRPALVFGRWSVAPPAKTRQVLIWDKGDWPGMGNLALPWGPSHEDIYVLGSGFVGQRRGSVIRLDRLGASEMEHPTQKPAGLLLWLLERTVGVAVDPFMGSGSTLVAAKNLGRKAIGLEIEERYCEIAARRLGQEVLALGEFARPPH